MRKPRPNSRDARCSAFEFPNIKSLLLKSKCPPGRPLPGQRIPTSIPQASAVQQTNPQLSNTAAPTRERRVQFNLTPTFSPECSNKNYDNNDTDSQLIISQEFRAARYIAQSNNNNNSNQAEPSAAEKAKTNTNEHAKNPMVQRVPDDCLRELLELGTLNRMLEVYTREIGQVAIDSHHPFRSAYFHGVVISHLGKGRALTFAEAVQVCESAVVLNNAAAPARLFGESTAETPSLLSFLNIDAAHTGQPLMPIVGGNEAVQNQKLWQDADLACMDYAMAAGHQIANLKLRAVQGFLARHIEAKCLIRPIYHYMYKRYADTQSTELPVVDEGMQFQIYSTVLEVMERSYGMVLPLPYVMYTTLFAIAETNEQIINGIVKTGGSPADVCLSVRFEPPGENIPANDAALLPKPLGAKELLEIMDWDFAAVIGRLLAHQYHGLDKSEAAMRAKLGALAFGVDTSQDQPYPPILPLQDMPFHQFVHRYVSRIYTKWPHGFVYMVVDEAVCAYNVIIQSIRDQPTRDTK